MAVKSGPLTREELQAVWAGALDKSYRDPLLQAGDGQGLEPHSLLWEVLGRTSRAIDVTTQAMFLCPWSGQTNPSAQGGAQAEVDLVFTRTERRAELPIYLQAGFSVVLEETVDWGETGGIPIRTGRRYVLLESVLFQPGEVGPVTVRAQADRVGYGYNNPLPGTLKVVEQFGAGFENNNGALSGTTSPTQLSTVTLTTENQPDMFIPEQIGQYVELAGFGTARIIGYSPPDESILPNGIGSQVILEQLNTFTATAFVGTFAVGDLITFGFGPGDPTGVLVGFKIDAGVLTFTTANQFGDMNTVIAGGAFMGPTGSGTIAHHLVVLQLTDVLAPPFGPGVSWRVLDWAQDLGIRVTNPESPTGGRAAFLDEIGRERDLPRGPGETDEVYRGRVKEIADVVSPNAIKRTLNRLLGAIPSCFREVGTDGLPGFFYDAEDAYDSYGILFTVVFGFGVPIQNEPAVVETSDGLIQYWYGRWGGNIGPDYWFSIEYGHPPPGNSYVGLRMRGLISGSYVTISGVTPTPFGDATKWHVYLNWAEFRGFFLVCLPRIGAGEFGMPYDDTTYLNAYDAILNNFYDGYPSLAPAFYLRIYQALNEIKAGGVGFELCLDTGCV